MSLFNINSGGIEGYCSNLVIDELSDIYFLSVAGYQTAVKGIIANVLEYGSVTLIKNDQFYYPSRSIENYNVHYQRLPSGLFQGVIIPKIALEDKAKDTFMVISDDDLAIENLFFRHLDHRIDLPLHPDWSGWLWNRFKEHHWLISLETLVGDFKGYLVDIDQTGLENIITAAIVDSNPDVIGCFQKGDRDGFFKDFS